MRALFSLVGLLVVLAIVMLLARKQLQAVAPATTTTTGAPPIAQEQARGVQQRVLQDVGRALEQGAARASDSQP